jgi:O-antigen/teichoic acid export membrane protein
MPAAGSPGQRSLQARQAVVARGLSILASFLLTIAVARMLGATAAGTFFIVFTSLAVFATLARFGTDNLALKLAGGASNEPRQDSVRLLQICGGAGVLSVLLAIAAFVSARDLLPGIDLATGLIVATAIVPQALSVLSGAIMRGGGRLATGTLAELGSIPALTLILVIGAAALARPTLTSSALGLSAASWLTAAWAVPSAVRTLRATTSSAGGAQFRGSIKEFLRDHAGRMAPMMGTSLMFYVLTWAPLFTLAVTRGPSEVAFFTVAARLAALVTLVPSVQVSYLAPAFARLYHHAQLPALNALCNRSAWQAAIAAALPTFVFVAAPRPVLNLLYGAGFSNATIPLILLTAGALLGVLVGQVNQLMLLCELEGFALLLNATWLVAWVTLGLWLSSLGGVVAASAFALGSSALYALVAAVSLARNRGIYSFVRTPVLG